MAATTTEAAAAALMHQTGPGREARIQAAQLLRAQAARLLELESLGDLAEQMGRQRKALEELRRHTGFDKAPSEYQAEVRALRAHAALIGERLAALLARDREEALGVRQMRAEVAALRAENARLRARIESERRKRRAAIELAVKDESRVLDGPSRIALSSRLDDIERAVEAQG